MKLRLGFVSNSSSSSFICDVTGDHCEGMDLELSDTDMYQCVNDHTFNEEFLVGELDEVNNDTDDDETEEDPRVVDANHCPICQLEEFRIQDLLGYACKRLNMTFNELKEEIKSKYTSYDRFKKDIPKYDLFTQRSND